jgi:hypothetical protein
MRKAIYVTDVACVTVEGDNVRAVLCAEEDTVILRGSRKTLCKALGLGTLALKKQIDAEVVSLRPHL